MKKKVDGVDNKNNKGPSKSQKCRKTNWVNITQKLWEDDEAYSSTQRAFTSTATYSAY